ncbi:MAG TPA: hypothetical protein VFH47_08875 [Candidatus Thermoplasmatota archaeon]|nr:hypothetical protein [Candidatus Thermoplasmatota archaeon]
MRLLAAAFLLVMLAGCSDRVATDRDVLEAPTVLRERYTAPDALDIGGSMSASAVQPIVGLASDACDEPAAECHRHPFTIAPPAYIDAEGRNVTQPPATALGNATRGHVLVEARLQWSSFSDFDLFLYQGDRVVATAENAPSEFAGSENLVAELPAGDYELVVLGWAVANDSYRLQATFTAVDGPLPAEMMPAPATQA